MKSLLALLLLTACAGASPEGTYKGYETPKYTVLKQQGEAEIREYPPILVAQVTVKGERKEAITQGFKLLAGYIFGDNEGKSERIAMTSPVIQARELPSNKGAEIAMTSPIIQEAAEEGWVVQFTMPGKYTRETLPAPKDKRIKLLTTPARKIAALRYSGWWSESNFIEARQKLEAFVKQNKLKTRGEIGAMYYDDPFTLPWNRRNEVMVELHD